MSDYRKDYHSAGPELMQDYEEIVNANLATLDSIFNNDRDADEYNAKTGLSRKPHHLTLFIEPNTGKIIGEEKNNPDAVPISLTYYRSLKRREGNKANVYIEEFSIDKMSSGIRGRVSSAIMQINKRLIQ